MKLTDLDPRWFDALDRSDGLFKRSGFTFLCPHCQTTRLAVTTAKLKWSDQMDALAKLHPDNHGDIVPGGFVWTINGDDFNALTVTPSIDCSAAGHWHGFITDGDIT